MRKKGFTLIEILVVVAIIGILTAVVAASLGTARARGRDARRIADLKQIQQAVENYFENNSEYPTADVVLPVSFYSGAGAFLASAPKDPLGPNYFFTSTPTAYCIGAKLELAVPAGVPPSSSCTLLGNPPGYYKVGGP